jgi:hypothetical protein
MGRKRILFVGGSLNQTTMMDAIAAELPEHDAVFSPLFGGPVLQRAADGGWLDFTTLGRGPRRRTIAYLESKGRAIDEGGRRGRYDMAVIGTDLIVPPRLRSMPIVLVQEGMTDPEDWRYHVVRRLGLPRCLANTSMTGLSGTYTSFCVASDGYRELFARKGAPRERLVVTGIPNFDDAASFLDNDFPHRGYVLAATSWLRESGKPEDRKGFIRRCLEIAAGRPLLFKLHPQENAARATREIEALAPAALVYAEGNTNHMIANCDVLVTRYSSVVYIALALGKEVHADVDLATLRALLPVQNQGRSAARIAEICRRHLS